MKRKIFMSSLYLYIKVEVLQRRQKGLVSSTPAWLVMIVEVGEGAAHLFQVAF
jgi:hypothetical protein